MFKIACIVFIYNTHILFAYLVLSILVFLDFNFISYFLVLQVISCFNFEALDIIWPIH